MQNTWDKVVTFLAGIAGAIAGLFGGWNTMLTILAIVMVVDYLSGLILAWRGLSPKTEHGGASSKAGFDGLAKKAVIILIILVATLVDNALNVGSMVFQTAACFYYVANEALSVLENAALLGVPFPAGLKNALEAMKSKGDASGGTEYSPPDDSDINE